MLYMFGKNFIAKQMLKRQMKNLSPEQQAQMEKMADDPAVQAQVKALLEKLSPEQQKELMGAMMQGDMARAQAILEPLKDQL